MKTIKDLTPDQFELLSLFATSVMNHEEDTNPVKWGTMHGIEWACTVIGVPDHLLYDVGVNHNFTGLRNHNRLTDIVYFK